MTESEIQELINKNMALLMQIAEETGAALETAIEIFVEQFQRAIDKLAESDLFGYLTTTFKEELDEIDKTCFEKDDIPRPNYSYKATKCRIINKRMQIRKIKKDVRNVTNRNNRVHRANGVDVYIY